MDTNQVSEGAPADDATVAAAPAGGTAIRQEEQGQQSQQGADYPTVDFGSCWYHEEAVKTGGK